MSEKVIGVRKTWTAGEDEEILRLVKNYGSANFNWSEVADKLNEKKLNVLRSGKQIRIRYLNQLDPTLKKGPFTAEEERQIVEFHTQNGTKWSKLAKLIPRRTQANPLRAAAAPPGPGNLIAVRHRAYLW